MPVQILARRVTKQYTSECVQTDDTSSVGLAARKFEIDDREERR